MQGFILEVSITRNGDELDTDHLTADTVLQLIDAKDFTDLELPVTEVEIDGTAYAVISVDTELNQVTIPAPGLLADYQAGEQVYTLPSTREKWALVEVNGYDEPISALVGGDLYDKITDGVRDPESQEQVIVELQNGDWTVINFTGEEPSLDGEFLDPETVPTNPEVDAALDELRTDVGTQTGQLEDILGTEATGAGRLQNVEETATQARNLANTADGRVSMSDYEPAPEDVSYFATDNAGNVVLDDLGNPILLNRNEGSIWFTRTRARVNRCTNPSFEVDVSKWSTSELAMARVAHAGAPAGAYVLELTNTAAAGDHVVTWDDGAAPRMAAIPGASYTWSFLAEAVSGVNTGVLARLEFFDAGGASLGVFDGDPATLIVGDWLESGGSVRPWVTAIAPDNTATVVGRAVNPNASAVWRIDAALMEMSEILGRYFDGSLYDSRWGEDGLGTPNAVASYMVGGKVIKIFELDDGAWVEKVFMGDVLVDLDASQVTRGFMSGERIEDRSIPIDKIAGVPATAMEALTAGHIVNVSNEGGAFLARLASASTGLEAHGFVLEDAAIGGIAYVYSHGYNPFLSDLEPGTKFLSTEAGGIANTPPQDVGTMVQRIGVAVGDSVLNFMQNAPIFIT